MSKQDLLKTQTCVLRVNIDCEGCKNKVKRTLQKIDGVYAVAIDMQQGKVTVTGNVEPGVLIKKLEKSGKRAELCSSEKGKSSDKSKKSGFDDNVNDQLKKLLQLGNIGKGGGVDDVKKPQQKGGKEQQKSGAINVSGGGKNLQQMKFQELLEQMKSGSKDFNMKGLQKPAAVKVESLPGKGVGHDFGDFSSGDDLDEDDDYSDDDEFDEDDDEFDEDEDEFDDDDEEEEEELDYGSDQNHKQQKTFMPITSNDLGKEKKGGGGGEKAKKGGGGGGGGGDDKKSGGIMSMIGRAIGGNNEGKDGNLGKKGGGEGGGKSQGGGKSKSTGGGGPKNGGEGKIGKKGGGGGGGKDGGFQGVVVPNHTKGGGGGMGQMVQYPAGPMGPQFPATPIMNMNGGGGGYYQGSMGPVPGNPYQQQQYMAMMMNQQRMMNGGGGGAGMYHPAMFGRPPPGYGYVPPPAYNDHITHMFSDENPGSCSIM